MPGRPYKAPRRLSLVTLVLLAGAAAALYGAAQFGPVFLIRWRAQSVLDDATYRFFRFSHQQGLVRAQQEQQLRAEVERQLRAAGVDDEHLKVWLDQTSREVLVRATFTCVVAHPIARRKTEIRLELEGATSTERPFE